MINKLKGAWRSLTIWFNALMLAALPLLDLAKESLPELAQYLPADLYKWVGLAVVLMNIALRFKTTTSLAAK